MAAMETTRGHFCGAFWPKSRPNLARLWHEEPRLKEPGPKLLTHGHTPAAKEKGSPKHRKPILKNARFSEADGRHGDDSRAIL